MSLISGIPAGRLPLALAGLLLVASASARAADISYYLVAKGNGFNQTTSAGPVPKGNPARFIAQAGLSLTNSATNATVQFLPGGTVTPLILGVGGKAGVLDTFSFQAKFASQSALDATYPNGNYQMVLKTVHDGTKTTTLALNGNAYPPSGPYITNPFDTNFTAPVVTNPAAPFTLTWAPLTGGTTNDFVQVILGNGSTPVVHTPDPGQPGALNGTATSLVIPANTLPSGRTSFGSLVFAKLVQLNSTSYPGVPGYAAYFTDTDFGLVALGEDALAYNIAKHQFFAQNNSGAPALRSGSPFRFVAQVFATTSNAVNTAQVQLPGTGVVDPLFPDPTDTVFANQHSFPTQTALDAEFVAGAYTFEINTFHDGNQLSVLTLPTDSFPIPPHVSDWSASQSINPAADFKLTWDAFSGATVLDDIILSVIDSVGNTLTFANLLNSTTNFDFPAGTFQSGQTYQAQVQFRHFVSLDAVSYPGVTGSVRFVSRTLFNLTAAGGTVAPMLAVATTNGASPFQLRLTGQAGGLYAIDASTNLQKNSWIPLVTNTAVGGQFIFYDTQSPSFPARFYRGRAAN